MESGILCSSKVLKLRFLPLAFSPSLTVASRLLHPYIIEVKTHRCIGVTVLHSQGYPEYFTDLFTEDKREGEDRGDQEARSGSQKGREQSSHQSNP